MIRLAGEPVFDAYRWLRSALGALSLLALEAAWTAPWVAMYFADCPTRTLGWWLAFLLVSGVAAWGTAGLLRRRIPEPARRRGFGLAAIGIWLALSIAVGRSVTCGSVPPAGDARPLALWVLQVPSLAALLLAVFWSWREAIPLATPDHLNPALASLRLRRALIGQAAFLLAFRPGLSAGMVAVITLTIASGLLATALSRASYLGQVRAAARLPFRGRWLVTLCAVCLLVLGIGLLLSAGLTHPTILGAAAVVLGWVARLLVAILAAVASVVIALGALLVGLFQVKPPPGAAGIAPATQAPVATPIPAAPSPWIPYFSAVGQQLELIFSLLILGLLAYFAVRGMGAMGLPAGLGMGGGFEPDAPDEESAEPPQSGRIRKAWDGLRRRAGAVLGGSGSASSMRGLYLRLLALARAQGRPRRPAETPRELLIALSDVFPGGEVELRQLTQGFEGARYGAVPDTPERLAAGRAALAALRERVESRSRRHR